MQERQVWSLGQEDPLEEETATHPSILAWKIPRTEEPGGLQSKGLQRVKLVWAQQHNKDLHLQQTSQMKDASYLVLGAHRFQIHEAGITI